MKSQRLLYVIDNLKTGGAEQVFADIAHLMMGSIEFDVLFILPQTHEAYQLPKGLKCYYLNRKFKFSIGSILECYWIIRKYSIVHIHLRHTFRYLIVIKKIFRPKILFALHDHYGSIKVNKEPPFVFYKYLKPDVYIGVCDELRNWAVDVWKIEPLKSFTLINLPSTRFLNLTNHIETNNTNAMGLVMVGNVKPIKNQEFAIQVAQTLSLPISIIGKNQDSQYYDRLQSEYTSDLVNWLNDIEDISSVIQNFKLGIYTSLSESGPLVLLEYLLCGLPFLAFKTGGVAEVIAKYFPEYFLETFEIEDWQKKILELMKTRARPDVAKIKIMMKLEFNRNNYRQKLLDIYEIK